MKNLILFSFLLILISCDTEEVDTGNNSNACTDVEYKIEFDLGLNEVVCLPDENTILLKDVQHHLCPCEANCEDEGFLLIVLETITINDDYITSDTKEFNTRDLITDSNIFSNHEITAFSYTYGNDDEEVPECAADFEPEKMNLTFIISEK